MISKRLSDLSHNAETFEEAKDFYESALSESGHTTTLTYNPTTNTTKKRRNRKRNIIWFNPPFNRAVSTNIGKLFFNALNKHFPKSHKYSKIFNRNNIKLSYSCTGSMKTKISSHNKQILKKHCTSSDNVRTCNCRNPSDCPLDGNCLKSAIIYKGTLAHNNISKTYIGCTETTFKERFETMKKF